MATPPLELPRTTDRSNLFIQVKSGTIIDALSSFSAWFRPSLSPPSSPSHRPSRELSQMIHNITLKDIQGAKYCGGGASGTVRIFEHPTEGKVALKHLRDDLLQRTLREGETWQELKHPHVLPFLAILETPTDLYLVSPYVKNGALDAYLRRNPDIDRHKFLWQTAGAITYLHEHGIVHGDIKAANILVSDDVEPLLCDFGLSKSDDGATSLGPQGFGTIRFQSLEVLTKDSGKSFASDIWAFGMTIFEVLSGKLPFHQYKIRAAIITAVVHRDERPPTLPSHSSSGLSYDLIWTVAQDCWQKAPLLRPSMEDIRQRLRPKSVRLRGHTGAIKCLAISPDGMTIVSASSESRTLRLWDVVSGHQRGEELKGHILEINCLGITSDSNTIVSGSWDCTLRLWDMASGSQRGQPLRGHTGGVTCLAITPDGMTIVSGSWDCTIRFWDMKSGRQRGRPLQRHTSMVSCLAITPDGKTIVSGSGMGAACSDYPIRIWDIASGVRRGEPLKGHAGEITYLAISPDGKTIVSGSWPWDRTLRLWDVASGSQRGELENDRIDAINCLAIAPDSMTIVSGSDDTTLQIWDVPSERQRAAQVLKGHTAWISCLAISADGMTIVSGSGDRTVRLWDMTSENRKHELLEGAL